MSSPKAMSTRASTSKRVSTNKLGEHVTGPEDAERAILVIYDAKDVRVPLVLLASKDEDVEAVQLFKSNLGGVESRVETLEI
ncbi:Hypothetical protein PENO1_002760 [Penicillium occitanis (nom. inval.)]|nr:hypothetical protein PENOC_016060 [Penicillium occitanis (nom. inval.)]PCH09230.1 Hypothetical protein PENO1_002760 [Penicillium occitanis (nom. inval.)]